MPRTHSTKLTDEQVKAIRAHHEKFGSLKQIQSLYGIGKNTVWRIVTYRAYEWVRPPYGVCEVTYSRQHHGQYRYKLTDDQVRAIRRKYKATEHLDRTDPNKVTYTSLMLEFNIGYNTVWKILTGKSYTWVREENTP